jgi:hypothetical protein
MSTISLMGRRLVAPALLLALAGCADPTVTQDTLPRKAISGSVTLDGQPLAEGKIQFNPVEAKPGESAVAVGDIKDGKYAIDRALGPVPGNYKVSISSVPSIKIDPNEGPGTRPKLPPEKVPAQYNTKTTLTKEIPADGSAPIDFPLTSK